MSKSTIRWWLIGSIVLALAVAPWLASGDAATRKLQKNNRIEITAMSETNRERLERNFETFKAMSPQEQQEVLSFHAKLVPNGEQSETLDNYISWLGTLEPYQRDRLNQVENSADRIELMKRIVAEQQERSVARMLPFNGPMDKSFLTDADLQKVMAEIERLSISSLSLAQKKELQPLEGVQRYYRLLKFLATDPLNKEQVQPFSQKVPPAFSSVVNKFDQLVEDSQLRSFVNQPGEEKVKNFTRLLAHSLFLELFQSKFKVSDKDLRSFFDDLSEEEQDQLLNLEAADFQSDLKHRYYREGGVNWRDLQALFLTEEQMRERWRGGPPRGPGEEGRPGFRPPGGGSRGRGDGPPPRDGRRRPGERRPEDVDRPPGPPPEKRDPLDKDRNEIERPETE